MVKTMPMHLRINDLADDHGALFWTPFLEKHHLHVWLDNREFFDHTMYFGIICLLFLYIGLAHLRILYQAAASVASMVAMPLLYVLIP